MNERKYENVSKVVSDITWGAECWRAAVNFAEAQHENRDSVQPVSKYMHLLDFILR